MKKYLITICFVLFYANFTEAVQYKGTLSINAGKSNAYTQAVNSGQAEWFKALGSEYAGMVNANNIALDIKYKLSTLMGEPVVNASARWRLTGETLYLPNLDVNVKISTIPDKILDSLDITNLIVRLAVKKIGSNSIATYIDLDMGAMKKQNGGWSFNTPGSPDWDELFVNTSAQKAKQLMKNGIRLSESFSQTGIQALNINLYDVEMWYKKKNKQEKRKKEIRQASQNKDFFDQPDKTKQKVSDNFFDQTDKKKSNTAGGTQDFFDQQDSSKITTDYKKRKKLEKKMKNYSHTLEQAKKREKQAAHKYGQLMTGSKITSKKIHKASNGSFKVTGEMNKFLSRTGQGAWLEVGGKKYLVRPDRSGKFEVSVNLNQGSNNIRLFAPDGTVMAADQVEFIKQQLKHNHVDFSGFHLNGRR